MKCCKEFPSPSGAAIGWIHIRSVKHGHGLGSTVDAPVGRRRDPINRWARPALPGSERSRTGAVGGEGVVRARWAARLQALRLEIVALWSCSPAAPVTCGSVALSANVPVKVSLLPRYLGTYLERVAFPGWQKVPRGITPECGGTGTASPLKLGDSVTPGRRESHGDGLN